MVRNATSAFVGADLETRLDELGATTLVLCGTLATHALEASARHAGDLGYQVFVVADACRAVDTVDLRGRLWLADDVRALSLAHLKGETAYCRCRDGASSCGDGQGAPAARCRKGLAAADHSLRAMSEASASASRERCAQVHAIERSQ
jgi:hypothetical protein